MQRRPSWVLCVAGLVAVVSPAAAAEVELSKGRLTVTDFIATQVVAVKNNTTKRISTIYVECGFFRANTLLAAARYYAENVEAGQTAYIEYIRRRGASHWHRSGYNPDSRAIAGY